MMDSHALEFFTLTQKNITTIIALTGWHCNHFYVFVQTKSPLPFPQRMKIQKTYKMIQKTHLYAQVGNINENRICIALIQFHQTATPVAALVTCIAHHNTLIWANRYGDCWGDWYDQSLFENVPLVNLSLLCIIYGDSNLPPQNMILGTPVIQIPDLPIGDPTWATCKYSTTFRAPGRKELPLKYLPWFC